MDIEIREMKAIDYSKVVLLLNSELGVNVNLEQFTSRIERMNKNNDYKTFVALLDNEVVGFITTVQTMALEFEIGYLKINGLAVQKNLQNKGIGTKLLKYTENYASKNGLSYFILNSGFQRTDAHAFYEHKGFDKRSYCFTKKIPTNNQNVN